MIRRFKKRVYDLRQQPEHIRIQAATKFTIIGTIICIVLWLGVFLPLQLRFRQTTNEATPEQQIQQAITGSTTTPTPTTISRPTPTSTPLPTPAGQVRGIELLPTSDDLVSPTPTP